ncbi:MAG TPA: AAA family ATPase, partial [Pseudonocardiaceae bacterium]
MERAELVERRGQLAELNAAVARARRDSGAVALVSGEAGIGKTALLRAFTAGLPPGVRVYAGACDALSTPRTLGPFRDMAVALPALRGADRDGAIDALLGALVRPAVVVVDDLHWADDASLDVVRHVARRVRGLPAVLVLAYRDDVPPGHPLPALLGALGGGPAVLRL